MSGKGGLAAEAPLQAISPLPHKRQLIACRLFSKFGHRAGAEAENRSGERPRKGHVISISDCGDDPIAMRLVGLTSERRWSVWTKNPAAGAGRMRSLAEDKSNRVPFYDSSHGRGEPSTAAVRFAFRRRMHAALGKGPTTDAMDFIATEAHISAHNYEPLGVIFSRGEGVWAWDAQGKRYLVRRTDKPRSSSVPTTSTDAPAVSPASALPRRHASISGRSLASDHAL